MSGKQDVCDYSDKGVEFRDFKGQLHSVAYSVVTPLGYRAYVSTQKLRYVRKHRLAAVKVRDFPSILNSPDLIVADYEIPTTHLYYRAYKNRLLVLVVHEKGGLHFLATAHEDRRIKGMRIGQVHRDEFLYIRSGFRWKKWK